LLTIHNKMLDLVNPQQANSSSTLPGRLPSKPKPNPKEHCNAIVLRSGKQLEGLNVLELKKRARKVMMRVLPLCLARISLKRR